MGWAASDAARRVTEAMRTGFHAATEAVAKVFMTHREVVPAVACDQ
jgi:hypothetical protein